MVQRPSAAANLDAWLAYLEALHPTAIDMGLERVQQVATALQINPRPAKVITVAGTNGKGSTVRYLETILRAAGYRTGVYISPHLHSYEERVRINAEMLSAEQHVQAFNAVEDKRGDTSLTYFEFGTLAAFWLLQQQQVDVWILEVGLGGRLDAVNCIDADVGVLTSVGIDHVGFLGPDRTSIAREKAGIFRADKVAVIGEPDFPPAILQELAQRAIVPRRVNDSFHYRLHESGDTWQFSSPQSQLSELPVPQLPLPNAATALMALEALDLPVSLAAIRTGLANAREAGRLELHQGNPDYLLDVAHNPHAAEFLTRYLQQRFPKRSIYAVVGMLKDKDIAGTLAALEPLVQAWYLADLSGPRGASAQELAAALRTSAAPPSITCFATVPAAFEAACARARDAAQGTRQQPLVLVCGSFYTVGQIT